MTVIIESRKANVFELERLLRPLWFGAEFAIEYKPNTGDVVPIRCTWDGRVWSATC